VNAAGSRGLKPAATENFLADKNWPTNSMISSIDKSNYQTSGRFAVIEDRWFVIGPANKKECPLETRPPKEHRAVLRVPGDTVGPLQLRSEPMALSFSANVRDVSIQGIGLFGEQAFVLGTSFVVESGPSGKGLPMALTAQLRHATMLPDGRWLLGCRFSRHLTIEDFERLG
jgi:hypothetical protein